MVTFLAAATSTLSSLFHVMGTSLGKDLYESTFYKNRSTSKQRTILFVHIGIVVGIIISLFLGYNLPINIVARATAMFFGIAVATFLSMFVLGLYWKSVIRAGAIAGMFCGACSSLFWLFFIHKKEAVALGFSQAIFGKPYSIDAFLWMVVDPILVALPIAFVVMVAVSLFTAKSEVSHLDRCFALR